MCERVFLSFLSQRSSVRLRVLVYESDQHLCVFPLSKAIIIECLELAADMSC
jgi:hypothetical protein